MAYSIYKRIVLLGTLAIIISPWLYVVLFWSFDNLVLSREIQEFTAWYVTPVVYITALCSVLTTLPLFVVCAFGRGYEATRETRLTRITITTVFLLSLSTVIYLTVVILRPMNETS